MNKFTYVIGSLFLSAFVLADDTEIYGTVEVDDDNRVNANVLFIMDTSGSMGGNVETSHVPYDETFDYDGDYKDEDVYNSSGDDPDDGHKLSSLSTDSPYNCTADIASINTVGKVLGTFYQYRSNYWRSLRDGNDGTIRCDYGRSYWLYSGNYMNWYHNYAEITNETRMKTVVDVVKDLTHSLSNVNLGLMRFDKDSNGGIVDIPIQDVATSGQLIRDKLDTYSPGGGTPLEESMYEAYRYFFGEDWLFGDDANPYSSSDDSLVGGAGDKYQTPIEAVCQKNHIILLTDGEPTGDTNANSLIRNLVANTDLPTAQDSNCSGNGQCMDELSYWMENNEHTNTDGVSSHTIGGFDLEEGVDLLKLTAAAGHGAYYPANQTTQLAEALENIFLKISETDATFTAPAVSVNAFNTSEHRDELFYALFRPDNFIKWPGNLKKFKISSDGTILDKNDKVAIDADTGFFGEKVSDEWSVNDEDGSDVTLGGMANLLVSANRKVWSEKSLTNSSLELLSTHTSDVNTKFDIADATEFKHVRDWVLGYDKDNVDGDASTTDRFSIGDPLHSEPVIVTYGGSDTSPDSTIFFGTNEGFIHAIDTETGAEEFAFLPQALHSIQKDYYENSLAASSKPYGMDGPLSTWFYDKNDDNIIYDGDVKQSGEHVYLYAGMRRGGRSYYGLDVTDRNNPELLFRIEGGTKSSNGDDFTRLGQTWSKMQIAKVRYKKENKFVLFFSGGYNTNQDGNTIAEADDGDGVDENGMGNAVYMVDASNGDLLWWASDAASSKGTEPDTKVTGMVNSIPASLSLIDHNGDGYTDYFFAADTGGRIIRFDIKSDNDGQKDFATGGIIAAIADTDIAGNRRFYNKPNVSIVRDAQHGDYLTIALGSGHRAHPKFTTAVENNFYVVKDRFPYSNRTSYTAKTPATSSSLSGDADPDLIYDLSDVLKEGHVLTSDQQKMLTGGGGWYVNLKGKGEKVLAESLTYAGTIIFTSFQPTSGASTSCAGDVGTSKVYALDQNTAMPSIDLDDDGKVDISVTINIPGIAPQPVIIIPPNTNSSGGSSGESTPPVVAVGTVILKTPIPPEIKPVAPIYWRQN